MDLRSVVPFLLCLLLTVSADAQEKQPASYAGSTSCRECHERFYQLWSTSKHDLAMQPYTLGFAAIQLTEHQGEIVIGKERYRADIIEGVVIETSGKVKTTYKIEHVLGGKNVYYFLTPF